MQRRCVWFEKPFCVSVREESIPDPTADQVLVQTIVSAISAGTELLFYRGQVPRTMPVDATIPALLGPMGYPLSYGYACVGRVIRLGSSISDEWHNRLVFSFQPHTSHFLARVDELIPLSDDLTAPQAVLLPNMETAVNLVIDGAPLIGENVIVLGQGIVGLLTTVLLAQMPLTCLLVFDRFALRRQMARTLGAMEAFDPEDAPKVAAITACLSGNGADLTYELTGNPEALNLAIALTGFEGRIVIGSWYGEKRAAIDLGSQFHRRRLRLISSQVSTLASHLTARWNKTRRLNVALALLKRLPYEQLITHRFKIDDAAHAYALLDQHPDHALQVLLEYDA